MAVFKVVGIGELDKYKDGMALEKVISYCGQDFKTPGKYIGGFAVNPQQAALEMEILSKTFYKDSGLRLRHVVLSFNRREVSNLSTAFYSAQKIAGFYKERFQIVFFVHKDRTELHIQFVMNTVSYVDGMKYSGTKKEYYNFLNYISNVLSAPGIGLHVDNRNIAI